MKKLAVLAVAIVLAFILNSALIDMKNFSTKTVTVYKIYNDIITIEDENGNLFNFFSDFSTDFKIGDKLKATFLTKGTKDIKDDSVIKIRR